MLHQAAEGLNGRDPLLTRHPLLTLNGLLVSSSTCIERSLKQNHSN